MGKITFLVKGSVENPYIVEFEKNGNNLTALCNCQAGIHGMYCKHRFRILNGVTDGIVSDNLNDVDIVSDWLKDSDLLEALDELCQAEEELTMAQKKVSAMKKNVAHKMND